MKSTLKKGFTLIELLVVITIIGILATGAVTIYTSQIQKARDTTRVNDVKAIQGAVEQVYQDDYSYPDNGNIRTAITPYMQILPEDSRNTQACASSGSTSTCGYVYAVGQDSNGIDGGSYEVSTAFENAGNLKNRAAGDGGEDDDRMELGTLKTGSTADDIDTSWETGDAPADGENVTR